MREVCSTVGKFCLKIIKNNIQQDKTPGTAVEHKYVPTQLCVSKISNLDIFDFRLSSNLRDISLL